ncbi:MAG: transposase [Gammaproteobacteria bacterium]|nr:transposase [Gammaproteobacteria bacterium]
MKRKVRRYTKEFKQEAVHLALNSNSVANTAKSLGIPVGTLQTWMEELKKKGKLCKVDAESGKDQYYYGLTFGPMKGGYGERFGGLIKVQFKWD